MASNRITEIRKLVQFLLLAARFEEKDIDSKLKG